MWHECTEPRMDHPGVLVTKRMCIGCVRINMGKRIFKNRKKSTFLEGNFIETDTILKHVYEMSSILIGIIASKVMNKTQDSNTLQ